MAERGVAWVAIVATEAEEDAEECQENLAAS